MKEIKVNRTNSPDKTAILCPLFSQLSIRLLAPYLSLEIGLSSLWPPVLGRSGYINT